MTTENALQAQTIDTVGLTCPGPVLSANQKIRQLSEGSVLEILSDCEGAADDLQAWATATGNQLLDSNLVEGHTRSYRIRKGFHAGVTLDLRGKRCPVPVIEASRAIGRLAVGETLLLVSDCPRAPEDIRAWIAATGHELLDSVNDQRGDRSFYIRRQESSH